MKKEEKIIADIIKSNRKYQVENSTTDFISRDLYIKYGNFSIHQVIKYFNSWTKASEEARGTFDLQVKEKVSDEERLQYEKKIVDLEQKSKDLEKEKKFLLLDRVNEDKLIDLYSKEILPIKFPNKIKDSFVKPNFEIEAILMLSDFHSAEVVNPDEIENVNSYNLKIMKNRLDRILRYFVYYCKANKITKVNIFFLGDLFSGDIHDELVRTNQVNVVEAKFLLLDYFYLKLADMQKHFSHINVEILVGNHGKFKKGKPEYKTAGILNWEYIFAENLKRIIKFSKMDKKIKINVNKSLFKTVEVAGRKFLLLHGHVLTGSGTGGFAGIPFYSLAISSAKFYGILEQRQLDLAREVPFQDILMGHLHQSIKFGIFNGGVLYINGCVIGINEYSLFKIKGIAKVEQSMLLVSNGRVVAEYMLWGDEK